MIAYNNTVRDDKLRRNSIPYCSPCAVSCTVVFNWKKAARNKCTLLRFISARAAGKDDLYLLESALAHFFLKFAKSLVKLPDDCLGLDMKLIVVISKLLFERRRLCSFRLSE